MKEYLKKISDVSWEIPTSTRSDMKVPARVYATQEMLAHISKDRSLDQLINVTTLPGILGHALAMPDAHEGYGFPIGGVAAVDFSEGVISPGGIGYDINCGVRLMKSKFDKESIKPRIHELAKEMYTQIPSGVGKGGRTKLGQKELDKVLNEGVRWAVDRGYASENDLRHTESSGSLEGADAAAVSDKAKQRGHDQLGTMGAGNHFVEVDYIDEIFDEEAAKVFGLAKNQIVLQIHTGSRGLGHQVATDFIRKMVGAVKSWGFELPDRELSCAPLSSPVGEEYLAAMSAAANYAWTNRQLIMHELRTAWNNVFGSSGGELTLLYDVAHNIAKVEQHEIDGQIRKTLVHRKGATRAFPPGHSEVPSEFKSAGQPVLIPGSMGTASYVLAGQQGSMEQSFGSSCHGAGRMMSRTKARKMVHAKQLFESLQKRGIAVQSGSFRGLAEEAPDAYKNVEWVVDVVEKAGIAKIVAKLKPMAVVKG